MFIKRNVPLPAVAPDSAARKGTTKADIAGLKAGESGVVATTASAARQTCQRIVLAWVDLYARYATLGFPEKAGDEPRFGVWKSNDDGSASETGKTFALVARLTDEQADMFRAANPDSVIEPRQVAPSKMQGVDADLARQSREAA